MGIEIQFAEVKNNNPQIFTFSKPVKQYMAGFSSLLIKFSKGDHHIKEISLDLSNSEIKDNQVIITPHLKMNDTSNHKESHQSSITIVVIAAVGDINPNMHIHTVMETNKLTNLPLINVKPTFIKSALSYSSAQYPRSDHHLFSYFSEIAPVLDNNSFVLKGQSVVQDSDTHYGSGKVSGGVLIYYGKDQKVLIADFDSKQIAPDHTGKIGDTHTICFGEVPDGFNCDNYELGCFINYFHVAYEDSTDHHVLRIEISAMLNENKIVLKDGKAYTSVCVKAFLTDEGSNQFNIPHNSVGGFVIAFDKKLL